MARVRVVNASSRLKSLVVCMHVVAPSILALQELVILASLGMLGSEAPIGSDCLVRKGKAARMERFFWTHRADGVYLQVLCL